MMRAPKKSDTIEVRLPHAVKRAFMAQCQAEGRTASDVVRGFVEGRIAGAPPAPTPAPRLWLRLVAAAAMIGALGLAMPSVVTAAPDFRPGFAAVDRNHDGILTPDEYGTGPQPVLHCGAHRTMALPLRRASAPEVRGIRPFAVAAADFSFADTDSNRDGKISLGEYAARRLRVLHAGFALLDADHDGRLTPREYAAGWSSFLFKGVQPDVAPFQELDRNGDGKVSWSEFLA
ncbi:EF-hand domain-containing protein [Sphingomonas sp. KR3-1]|uniref:EF-hand domain-containing protein n=1 Tax=Sphingomonas sp. KR3-1 TaxID=3156611 RepID=UPI0032B43BF3